MAETEGQQRLDLLVKQRRTNGSETVFDASQFKNLVQKDVPSNIIDQLQKEFGEDMAGGKTRNRRYQSICIEPSATDFATTKSHRQIHV